MSLAPVIKRNKVLILLILAVLVLVFILGIILSSKEKSYVFKTEETNFTVRVPNGWTVIDEYRRLNEEGAEPSPDEGIKLLLDGNEDNFIWIYSQYGKINLGEGNYEEEAFSTKKGIPGILYKDKDSQLNWYLILNQDIAPDHYGAVVRFKDKKLFDKKEKQIRAILKSIEISKP